MVLIFLGIFEEHIKYDMIYKGAVLATFLISFVEVLNQNFKIFEGFTALIKTLPFSSVGFEWLLPAIVTGAVFGLIAFVQDKRKIA
ncbi:MAG: branched-chain amino acid transport system II carrier protein, partial [Finegoldia magna]|nr:branched-chain amino acid transport system II carrier protein [Finegoldia magna]